MINVPIRMGDYRVGTASIHPSGEIEIDINGFRDRNFEQLYDMLVSGEVVGLLILTDMPPAGPTPPKD
jgi:hypothetical protein